MWSHEDRYLVLCKSGDTVAQHYMGWIPSIEKVTDNPYTQVIKSLRDFIQRGFAAQKKKFLYHQVTVLGSNRVAFGQKNSLEIMRDDL